MVLSEAQQVVVNHAGGPLAVAGGFGAGKTTALVHRWRRLAGEHGSGRVAFVVRNAAAADDVRRRMLEVIAATGRGAVGPLVVTTFAGLALDILRRHGARPEVRLIAGDEQRAVVAALLADDARRPAERWPTLAGYVGRKAFAPEVAEAVLVFQASAAGADWRTLASNAGVADRWDELAAFVDRYQAALGERGAVDTAGVLVAASALLDDAAVLAAVRERFAEFLVDDFEMATAATDHLLTQLAGPSGPVTVTGNPDAAIGAARGASPEYFERRAAAAPPRVLASFSGGLPLSTTQEVRKSAWSCAAIRR